MTRDRRTIRESRRTYRRRRCTWTEPTGWRCRARPQPGSDRCLLHAEVEDDERMPDTAAVNASAIHAQRRSGGAVCGASYPMMASVGHSADGRYHGVTCRTCSAALNDPPTVS